MRRIHMYTEGLAERLIGKKVRVLFVKVPRQLCGLEPWGACYGRGQLLGKSEFHYNVGVLGRAWFDAGATAKVDELVVHELGHEYSGNHLSDEYHKGLCKLAARLKKLALGDPEWFKQFVTEG